MERIVFVEGNIIAYSGNHLAKGLVCFATDEYKEKAVEVINGDLELYEHNRIIPFYTYAARGGVTSLGHNLGVVHSPSNVLNLYKEEIEKIKRLLNLVVPEDLRPTHNRHLFIGVIGTLELFLSEMISCLVLGEEQFYHNFIENTSYKISLKDIEEGGQMLDKAIYKVIHNINAHKLKEIKDVFKNVFDVNIPNTTELGRYIEKRHDLVHRNGNRVDDRTLRYVDITDRILQDLILVVDTFVDHLMDALVLPIEKWNEGFENTGTGH